ANSLINGPRSSSNYPTMPKQVPYMDITPLLGEARAKERATTSSSKNLIAKKNKKKPRVDGTTQEFKESERPTNNTTWT
ncbi:hypothetical protein J1N35_013843, partial [Gossypium stocksii]